MPEAYNKADAEKLARQYRNMQADVASGELAWRKAIRPLQNVGVRDSDQYIEEGMYKNWENASSFGPDHGRQTLPEDRGNRASIIGQTPSASVYFRKKYFRSLAATAGWTTTFQEAVTTLLINKSIDVASVEALTKYKYMYGVREETDGALTRNNDGTPVGKESNHYRMYWYGDNVGNSPGGILEVTNFQSLNTSLSLSTGDMGSCTITIEDPYNLLFVSKKYLDRLFKSVGTQNDSNASERESLSGDIRYANTVIDSLEQQKKDEKAALTKKTSQIDQGEPEFAAAQVAIDKSYDDKIADEDKSIKESQDSLNALLPPVVAELKSGGKIYSKGDVDYLYQYVAGRSIFTVMDEIYVWMSPEKESLFSFDVRKDLLDRKAALEGQRPPAPPVASQVQPAGQEGGDQAGIQAGIDDANAKLTAARELSRQEELDDINSRLAMFHGNGDFHGFALTGGVQVFSGLVSSVTETWSDGSFKNAVSASSNLKFLDMSRFTPAGSAIDSFGLLDTPITFYRDASGKVRSNWLYGIHTMNGRIPGSNGGQAVGSSVMDANGALSQAAVVAAGMDIKNFAYASYDPANLISQLMCGVIFDPNMQLAISMPDDKHKYYRSSISSLSCTPLEGQEFMSQLRRIVEAENRVMGNFIPFAWVPADILSYDTAAFPDMSVGHLGALNTGTGVALNKQYVVQLSDKAKKAFNSFLGSTVKLKDRIDTTQELVAYANDLDKLVNDLTPSVKSPPDPTSPVGILQAAAVMILPGINQERENVRAALRSDNPSAEIPPFSVNSIVGDYPVFGVGDELDNAGKCLQYSDAQKFILMNAREDIVTNVDQKYVVIDMTYLASVVARAYCQQVSDSPSMWTSNRISQMDAFKEIVNQMEWEGFSDTQGNIIYRKRQFNCVPASVYKRYIVPYVKKFVDNVLKGQTIVQWAAATASDPAQRERDLINNLGGVDLSWVLVYQSAYMRAQLVEPDYPIDTSSSIGYETELLSNGLPREASGSHGERYHTYISDDVVMSWSFAEKESQLSRIDVIGQMDMYDAPTTTMQPHIMSAAAVDYDMWFHYGYKKEQVTKAWIKDPEKQGVPFAIATLAHARAKVLDGTITVIGSPFYQPGEVVYVESRNMLYYVNRVAHSLTYGGDYRTTLTLEYGHFPGAWIVDPYYVEATTFASGCVALSSQELQDYMAVTADANRKSNLSIWLGQGPNINAETGSGAVRIGGATEAATSGHTQPTTYVLDVGSSGSSYRAGVTPQMINDGIKPKSITSTFDPAITDRLRAAKFYRPGGLNYEGIRKDDKGGG